ncbi:hypothetical protein Ancab_004399 [Ancistrocladus abbreviatus]
MVGPKSNGVRNRQAFSVVNGGQDRALASAPASNGSLEYCGIEFIREDIMVLLNESMKQRTSSIIRLSSRCGDDPDSSTVIAEGWFSKLSGEVWNASVFAKIANMWGMFIRVDDCTRKIRSFELACILILTSEARSIKELVQIMVNGHLFSIKVEEELDGEMRADCNLDMCSDQATWEASGGCKSRSSGDAKGCTDGCGLIVDEVGLSVACGLELPSKRGKGYGPASQESDSLNMVISRLKNKKMNGRPKQQHTIGLGFFHKMKISKKKAITKRKSARVRENATVTSCTIEGDDESSKLASTAAIVVPNSPSESDSLAAAKIWEHGKISKLAGRGSKCVAGGIERLGTMLVVML